jgi:hypothetical protein
VLEFVQACPQPGLMDLKRRAKPAWLSAKPVRACAAEPVQPVAPKNCAADFPESPSITARSQCIQLTNGHSRQGLQSQKPFTRNQTKLVNVGMAMGSVACHYR